MIYHQSLKQWLGIGAMALTCLSASAVTPPVKIGVRTGVNISKINETRLNDGAVPIMHTSESKPGFSIGAVVDVPISRHFALQPGFYYNYNQYNYSTSTQFARFEENELETRFARHVSGRMSTNWFQVPVLISYRLDLSFVEFQVDFGPYFAIGLGGTDKVTSQDFGNDLISSPETVKYNAFGHDKDARYKNYNWGFDFGVGLVFARHYYVGAHYLVGCPDISKAKTTVDKAHTSEWQICVGYNF